MLAPRQKHVFPESIVDWSEELCHGPKQVLQKSCQSLPAPRPCKTNQKIKYCKLKSKVKMFKREQEGHVQNHYINFSRKNSLQQRETKTQTVNVVIILPTLGLAGLCKLSTWRGVGGSDVRRTVLFSVVKILLGGQGFFFLDLTGFYSLSPSSIFDSMYSMEYLLNRLREYAKFSKNMSILSAIYEISLCQKFSRKLSQFNFLQNFR
jgi:hypothetical protein